jgi:DNA-binding CsgD family transcriptional regulator
MDVMEALSSSLDLSEVLKRTHEVISKKVAADYAAFCVTKPGTLTEYEWMVAQMPAQFFAHYDEMAKGDFVRDAVMRQPNLVLRDTEMIPREELERSLMYQRCRELGMPLEHVMAVLLDMGHDGHGGFMLYRDKRYPFSEQERALLQRLTPMLTTTLNNCRKMREVRSDRWVLEEMLRMEGSECVVLTMAAKELMRTGGATRLLEDWFGSSECGRHRVPAVLVERLVRLVSNPSLVQTGQNVWKEGRSDRDLVVKFSPLAVPDGRHLWVLSLREVFHAVAVPLKWSTKLTKRELQVVTCLLRGWDNRTIAEDLKCSVDTVKKHLQHIFDKMGVDQRAQLIAMAKP